VKRAFTLIELLVVIAIIAILAAILFPVFAQAKAQAKKAADLSNNKQMNLAAQMYLNDSDDLYPLEAGQRTSDQHWMIGYRLLVPPTFTLVNDQRAQGSYGLIHNTSYPYIKNRGLMLSPVGAVDVNPFAAGQYPNIGPDAELKYTYTFNGLLNSYNSTAIQAPAQIVVWWAGWGNAANNGWAMGDPELFCNTNGAPCSYQPCGGSGNGSSGNLYGPLTTYWGFPNGQNWAYADGHAKFRKMGTPTTTGAGNVPPFSNYLVDPWTNYTPNHTPNGWLWYDGCFPWLFRPDYVDPLGY